MPCGPVYICAMLAKTRREKWIPWSWSYRWSQGSCVGAGNGTLDITPAPNFPFHHSLTDVAINITIHWEFFNEGGEMARKFIFT